MQPAYNAFVFWFAAAVMAALALAFVLPRLLARRGPAARADRNALNAAIYRRELAELDRQRTEERMPDAQYASAREELERRLLGDLADEVADGAGGTPPRGTGIVMAIALPALAFGIYAMSGDPGAIDGATMAAPVEGDGAVAFPVRRDELVGHLTRNARDGRGWVLLARMDFAADRFGDATASYRRALAVSSKVAADAGVWCEYADALAMQQGGTLAGRPRELVMHALTLNAAHPRALEMAGSAAYEQREFASAAYYWRQLITSLPDGSPEQRELAAAIALAERLALGTGGPPAARP